MSIKLFTSPSSPTTVQDNECFIKNEHGHSNKFVSKFQRIL
jgi:hypothetical protein